MHSKRRKPIPRRDPYQDIFNRVTAGEVVSVDTLREDINDFLNWLNNLPPQTPNWKIQLDYEYKLMWLMLNTEERE